MATSSKEEIVEFTAVEILRTSDKAMLCEIEGDEHWIPYSQLVEKENEVTERGDIGKLAITQWIAEQKGLV